MNTDNREQEGVFIDRASAQTGLPEETIRNYVREFRQFLNVKQNYDDKLLFTEQNLIDIEYVHYLVAQEGLTVEQAYRRLEQEGDFDPEQEFVEAEGGQSDSDYSSGEILLLLKQLNRRLDKLEERQDEIRELLDMNLQRYNKLVEQF